MGSRAVLILLGVVAGLALLFQGATASTSVMSNSSALRGEGGGGGECVDAHNCCGAQNCVTAPCDNTGQINVIVIQNVNVLSCDDILNNATIVGLAVTITGLLTGDQCDTDLIDDLAHLLTKVDSSDIECCNYYEDDRAGNGNCNFENNECVAQCKKVVNRGGDIVNQCESNCCSFVGC